MKTYKILFFIILCFFSVKVVAQLDSTVNQFKNDKKKDGLYIENEGLIEAYYKNGARDGLFKSYNRKNGKLSALGEYTNGEKTGIWYYFDEASHLIMQVNQIKKNKIHSRLRDDNVNVIPNFISFVKFYYHNGYIKEEGYVLYNEDIEIDYFKIGTWKYFNKQGELEKIIKH